MIIQCLICFLQDLVMIENMKKLENKVSCRHRHGGQSKIYLNVKKNVPAVDIEKHLQSKEKETRRIVIFLDG